MDNAVKLLGADIAMVGSLGAGVGIGLIFSAWINAIARNPSVESKVRPVGLMGFALAELVLLMCFVIAIMRMYAV
jgi:F0F1-type ATP synthase membrane subunit c/vacuolar-type H+-ATPase subunit K